MSRRAIVWLALGVSLALNLALGAALFTVGAKAKRVTDGLFDYARQAEERRIDAMDATALDEADVVFLGDSLTWEGSWPEYFPDLVVANRGVGGDRVSDLTARLDGVAALRPEKLFIMAGINDLNFSRAPAEVIEDYEILFDAVKRSSPGTEVYLQSVLPTNDTWVVDVPAAHLDELNAYLSAEAAERGWTFIDLRPSFTGPGGRLPDELTNDGIHLRGDGYRLWSGLVRPDVE